MKKLFFCLLLTHFFVTAQTNPAITKWLQNTSVTGTYYVSGNSTPISNGILVNCQQVRYSTNWAYVNTTGIPAYAVGPYLDGNPSQAGNQNAIFKFPLNPTQNTGTATATSGGNIGVFINGVAMFDFRDGAAWNSTTNALCGGPGNPTCTGTPAWNRDAILYEKAGFDCSKGHPAGTNYHHHQNPSAFDLDLTVISNICNLYDADGLYTINTSQHSPLIGFAYDGFPIYGAYGYTNTNGTGGITRIKSGYQLRNITVRTHYSDGTNVSDGPAVSASYPLGYFREDYEWVSHPGDASYLDEHNGRFCITPEYPAGIYCYFATVDANHNSAYPYLVGPTYYGNKTAVKVASVSETTTTYSSPLSTAEFSLNDDAIKVFPNPASDLIAIQMGDLVTANLQVELYDVTGRLVKSTRINSGQTITYFDVQDVYNGTYFVKIFNGKNSISRTIIIKK
ncbi:YHYH protein [Flavobacterium sp.]|uniref:YHYH protein n=1 Tax=Flavobacterium sp. TaxID=239 RepID=UPI00261F2253|nr:YHYH protein [Flavobacterium sp.]